MKKFNFKITQWGILIISVILSIIGLIALFSATKALGNDALPRQIIWFIISIIACMIVTFIDYEKLIKISPFLYIICIALLVGVLFTSEINGAHSWYNLKYLAFQPTELTKPVFILFTAFLISKIQKNGKENISKFKNMFLLLVATMPVIALIVVQPDFGTALSFLISFIMMIIIAGLDNKYFIFTIPIVCVCLFLAFSTNIIPEHAKNRIETFFHPEEDALGKGYSLIQSKLAIGSGELTGMGLLKGNQTQLGYLSPKTTDFIFSVIGEEMGFLGAGLVIILYTVLLSMLINVSKTSKTSTGSIICAGVFGLFAFHIIENISMTMGLLPITGVPLPFISYGGSSLLTNFICIGIVLNISSQRQKTIFIGK